MTAVVLRTLKPFGRVRWLLPALVLWSLNVKAKVNYVAILNDVIFSF